MYFLSPVNLSSRFLNVFKVGAVTISSGSPFQEEITLTEKKFLRISFLQYFFFNLRAWPLVGFSSAYCASAYTLESYRHGIFCMLMKEFSRP